MKKIVRSQWKIEELQELYDSPLLPLLSTAHHVHAQFHPAGTVQICSLISIKTGGCQENCKYCAQSSRYQTAVTPQPLMSLDEVLSHANTAIGRGATRICLGAAWREVKDSPQFERILQMVKEITALGAEVCCTLGMLSDEQAQRLKDAGLYAYNHNLDTSEKFYPSIITSRTYADRLKTLDTVQNVGLSVCCGGILGMGEDSSDRLELLHTLCTRDPHPDSVPINRLAPIPGTPLQEQPPLPVWELMRIIAIARIVMPKTMIRLSCGRSEMSYEEQALCFMAGANSIFLGEKLLTVANTLPERDAEMFRILGLTPCEAFAKEGHSHACP